MALVVGLTGGIGSGKSTVSRQLGELGAIVIDYDVLAREAVEPGTPALAAIAERFGQHVIAEDGQLIRPALGAIVFADDQARSDLEAITHPAIAELARGMAAAAGEHDIVVHDNALLVEMGAHRRCDVVLVVDLPEDLQVQRLVTFRGMTEADARARIATQATRQQRTAVADHVIDNSGSAAELAHAVSRVWTELVAQAASSGSAMRRNTDNASRSS